MAQKCPTTGRFLKGHKLSLGARGNQTNNGQVFDTGEEVLQAGADYFQWLEDHPLNVPQTSVYKGEVTKYTEERPRVATLEGFAQHCGVLVNQIFVWCKNTRRPGARDNQMLCDSAEPMMILALQASGVPNAAPAMKGAGSILAGITKLQSCIIMISPECPEAYAEFKGPRWATDPRTGKVKWPLVTVGSDHVVDASRYALSETELAEVEASGVALV